MGETKTFRVPLFPLPNVVLFPRVTLPLRVFELRYRWMLKDALAADRRIAVAMLQDGWERNYYGSPPIHPVFTVGRVVRHEPQEDGASDILLFGEEKVRLVSEVPHELYRIGQVESCSDEGTGRELGKQAGLDRRIRQSVRLLSKAYLDKPRQGALGEALGKIRQLGELTDFVAFSLVSEARQKQALLEMTDVLARAEELQRMLESWVKRAGEQGPPPARHPFN